MKLTVTSASMAVLAGWAILVASARAKPPEPLRQVDPAIYQDLRNHVLRGSRSTFGLQRGSIQNEPWGVVMDVSFADSGTYSVVALSDGSASIYLSSGGGSIGGAGHPAIRLAALKMVKLAPTFLPKMSPAKAYPLPTSGNVTFYVLTDKTVYSAGATENELGEQQHALSPLFYAAQDVISEYRKFDH